MGLAKTLKGISQLGNFAFFHREKEYFSIMNTYVLESIPVHTWGVTDPRPTWNGGAQRDSTRKHRRNVFCPHSVNINLEEIIKLLFLSHTCSTLTCAFSSLMITCKTQIGTLNTGSHKTGNLSPRLFRLRPSIERRPHAAPGQNGPASPLASW